jgi:hypothetical protein
MDEPKKTFKEFLKETPKFACPEIAELKRDLEVAFGLDVVCLPCDDPILGEVGYVIFHTEGGQEKSVIIRRAFGPVADGVKLLSKKEIENEYDRAVANDQAITRYDDPVRMIVGFIVYSGSGRRWYHIDLKDLKASE